MLVLHCFCCGWCRGWGGDKPDVGVVLPLADPCLENDDPSVVDDFLLPSLSWFSPSSSASWGGDRFEATVAVVVAARVVDERVGVADEVEDDGEFVGEIAAAENEDELFDDADVVVDGEAAPPTLSAPNDAAVPNVPVVVAPPAGSKPRDVEDTASSVSPYRHRHLGLSHLHAHRHYFHRSHIVAHAHAHIHIHLLALHIRVHYQ
jgi:hypothetical protein